MEKVILEIHLEERASGVMVSVNLAIFQNQNSLFLFCVGIVGKMFKSVELPWLITFFQMFYNDKPVDWLLEHLIYTKVCNWEKDMVSLIHSSSSSSSFRNPSGTCRLFCSTRKFEILCHFRRNIASKRRQNCGYTTNHHCSNTSAPHHR